jgi:ribosomal-protein-alanine N-acetyltransferase
MSFDFSVFPTLATDRLMLRELQPADAADLFTFRSDAEEQKYNSAPMVALSEAADLIAIVRKAFAKQQQIQFGVALRDSNRVIGLMGFNSWDRYHHRAEIGYDLSRAWWGQGLAYEAVDALLRWGFEQLDLHRVELETIADNTRSIRLAERLSFQREGVRREVSFEDDGAYHDVAIYGLLRAEYRRSS